MVERTQQTKTEENGSNAERPPYNVEKAKVSSETKEEVMEMKQAKFNLEMEKAAERVPNLSAITQSNVVQLTLCEEGFLQGEMKRLEKCNNVFKIKRADLGMTDAPFVTYHNGYFLLIDPKTPPKIAEK